MEVDQQTFIPGRHKLKPGEVLQPDVTTYEMLHTLGSTWPCLSLDLVQDNLGSERKSYPMTVYAVAGTQAADDRKKENQLMVMKLSGLGKMDNGAGNQSEDEDDDSDAEDSEPILETKVIPLTCATNRIRQHQAAQVRSSDPPITTTASMMENGQVLIYDVTPHLTSFDTPGTVITPQQNKPISTIRAHKAIEGYALDWSPLHNDGRLVTGDGAGKIFLTTRTSGGGFVTDTNPFSAHTSSVEELHWSPLQSTVFASASSDGTIKIWDTRSKQRGTSQLSTKASKTDINVLSWSALNSFVLASGDEDGRWNVWDTRNWLSAGNPERVASYNFHKEQITSLEFHPSDDSIILVGAGDSTITLWDISAEEDDEENRAAAAGLEDIPKQLLFVHYMEGVKEAHWHRQIPGVVVATGAAGFGYVDYGISPMSGVLTALCTEFSRRSVYKRLMMGGYNHAVG